MVIGDPEPQAIRSACINPATDFNFALVIVRPREGNGKEGKGKGDGSFGDGRT